MARRKRNDTGEHFTAFLGFQLPPTLLTELKTVAANCGTTSSDLARQILAQGLGGVVPVAAARPDPHFDAKMRAATNAMHTVSGLRSLMNQIARHGNTRRSWVRMPRICAKRSAIAIAPFQCS